ncbi:MAG: insulinase family protein [Clostridia bacterium]|nr:insulinase family protein [Clostridia bacterium]
MTQEILLANGMTVLACPMDQLHSIEMGLYFKGGALYENRQNQGISHLLEHLCFRSLNGLTQRELYAKLDAIGATLRGSTYQEALTFRLETAPKYFDAALELMSRFFLPYTWTPEEIDQEKRVVLRQIQNDAPGFQEKILTKYWQSKAGAFPLMGTEKSVTEMTAATIHKWKKNVFQPQNACFVITGNFSQGMLSAVQSVFEEIANTTQEPPFEQTTPVDFCMRDGRSDQVINGDWDWAQVQLSFDVDDDLVFPLCTDVLNWILGVGLSSSLFMELRETLALTDDIQSRVETAGLFRRLTIDYFVPHEHLVESLERIGTILSGFKRYVPVSQMERTRAFFTDNLRFQYDQASEMNELMGFAWLSDNIAETDLETQAAMYEDMTCEDLNNAAQAIFRPENLVLTLEKNPKHIASKAVKDAIARLRRELA